MLKRLISSLILCTIFAAIALAHGDPITGTVTAVTNDTFTIKQAKDDKAVTIMLVKDTKFVKDAKPAKKSDLKVGVRVVIDAHMDKKMNMYNAEEIQIGTATTKGK